MIVAEIEWVSVWLLGLSVGLTTCTLTCLPYMGSWALGRGEGGEAAALDTAAFALGKIAAYATLGSLAGVFGQALILLLKGGIGHYLIGAASIFAGIWLLIPKQHKASCGRYSGKQRLSPFFMGYTLSFTPCAPLAALLGACATSGGLLNGAGYGALFGFGAALTPLFIVIPLLGAFGRKLKVEQAWLGRWLLRGGATVLILIGVRRILLA